MVEEKIPRKKKRLIKPTYRQRKAVERIIANNGNISQSMVEANYSVETAHTPQKLTESKGFQILCDEYGLTDELILSALVEDIRSKPQNRKGELELGAKIRGRLKDNVQSSHTERVVVLPYELMVKNNMDKVASQVLPNDTKANDTLKEESQDERDNNRTPPSTEDNR